MVIPARLDDIVTLSITYARGEIRISIGIGMEMEAPVFGTGGEQPQDQRW